MKTFTSHIAIICANIIWGLYATICKGFLISGIISSWGLCGIKMIGGAILLWCIAALLPSSIAPRERIDYKDIPKLFLASMLINAGSQSCIIIGLNYTSPVDGTVICSMAPIFTVVLGILLLKQNISIVKSIGIALGFGGAILFVLPGLLYGNPLTDIDNNGNNPLLGNVLIIASQIFGALYLLLFTNVLSRYSAVTLIKWLFLFSAIVLLPFTATDIYNVSWSSINIEEWLQLGYIIIFATGLAYLLLVVGQKGVSPTAISMYNYLQPITATISSIALGIATITGQQILATILCLVGVYIVIKK